MLEHKATLCDAEAVSRMLMRMAHQIVERNRGAQSVCLIGIKRRGVPMARMLAENIRRIEGVDVAVGELDITYYRDDLTQTSGLPELSGTDIPFDINGKDVVLVDDVLFTGRTVRAAIEGIFERGRPASVQLAVLIDRGHRQLPIRAEYVGKNIPTSLHELVAVHLPEFDGETSVELLALN